MGDRDGDVDDDDAALGAEKDDDDDDKDDDFDREIDDDEWEDKKDFETGCPCDNVNCTETSKSVQSIRSIGAITPGCMYVVKAFCVAEEATKTAANEDPSQVCKKFLRNKGRS